LSKAFVDLEVIPNVYEFLVLGTNPLGWVKIIWSWVI